jgi:DNA-binding response OmpR family regulator
MCALYVCVINLKMSNHILILEDNQDILQLMSEVLIEEGYQVTGLTFCENIIKTVDEHKPDLVMLDYLLHGINGGELCHEIKSHPSTNHLPVIIISGYPRVLQSLGDYGSDAFVAKPFSIDELVSVIHKYLPVAEAAL